MSKATQFLKGARLGMPIALGYIPVSFSFGMLAVQNGIPAWAAIVISMTNLTSAGQFAGMNIISAAGGMWEMTITSMCWMKTDSDMAYRCRLGQRLMAIQ